MSPADVALLVGGGILAGVVNTLAGGGSLLTVPLLVVLGLPGTIANGTNRVGILVQSLVASRGFRARGVSGFRAALPLLVPVLAGSVVGALAISRTPDATFERVFGVLMLLVLVPTLRRASPAPDPMLSAPRPRKGWPPSVRAAVFFGIGLYGGAFQAGVGIVLLFALSHAGFDLVRANAIKMVVVAALTAVAVPVFVLEHQIEWLPAAVLACGYAVGGALGARLAVQRGERLIRPVLAASVLALAGRMLGFY
ncbi:MAG: sulfite exporter TauE/SafE family protein [Myxococcales bacterium]|nr:sulfite exporter TauE/SafE family protein [Myxococcales bacterium]